MVLFSLLARLSNDMQIEIIQLLQMKEAQEKLHSMAGNGNRDLSKWRLAKFDCIFSNTMISKQQKITISAGMVDSLFSFEEAVIASIKFTSFDSDAQDKTNISYLIRPMRSSPKTLTCCPKLLKIPKSFLRETTTRYLSKTCTARWWEKKF